jgi:S1-C subfamily serine protease
LCYNQGKHSVVKMKSKHPASKTIVWVFIPVVLVLAALPAAALTPTSTKGAFDTASAQTGGELGQEELANLVKPAVVRVVQRIIGSATIAPFDVDLLNLTVNLLPKEQPLAVPVNAFYAGSGFAVNSDGHIVTNAHVVSEQTVRRELVTKVVATLFLQKYVALSAVDQAKIDKTGEEAMGKFLKQTVKTVLEKSSFTLERKIVVLNPASSKEVFTELFDDGFVAEVVKVNDNFADDDKDIAIIKIDQANIPAVALGDSASLSVGKKAYVFGFPATAELGGKNFLQSTFTGGVVSAIKDSPNKDFKIYQTDAKVSQGSSGGPLLNGSGEVVGVVTYQTGDASQASGDNFAFAIPVELVKEFLTDAGIASDAGAFRTHFQVGLKLLGEKRCKKALAEFRLSSEGVNANFPVSANLETYQNQCNQLIAAGKSIDSKWDEIIDWLRSVGWLAWVVILGGLAAIVALAYLVMWLYKRMRKEEKEIVTLENRLEKEEVASGHTAPAQPNLDKTTPAALPPEQTDGFTDAVSRKNKEVFPTSFAEHASVAVNPTLVDYVRQARKVGMSDEAIVSELKTAGWPEEEVYQAMRVK